MQQHQQQQGHDRTNNVEQQHHHHHHHHHESNYGEHAHAAEAGHQQHMDEDDDCGGEFDMNDIDFAMAADASNSGKNFVVGQDDDDDDDYDYPPPTVPAHHQHLQTETPPYHLHQYDDNESDDCDQESHHHQQPHVTSSCSVTSSIGYDHFKPSSSSDAATTTAFQHLSSHQTTTRQTRSDSVFSVGFLATTKVRSDSVFSTGFTDADRTMLMHTLAEDRDHSIPEEVATGNHHHHLGSSTASPSYGWNSQIQPEKSASSFTTTTLLETTTSLRRSIPVPKPPLHNHSNTTATAHHYNQHHAMTTNSQPSSHGSSGSAFLSSVLNQSSSGLGMGGILAHTPPTGLGTSYETSHFGKRPRSGSVSGRLRSASEYLEDKGLLDRTTKGILKDLIIIGDEELQHALDKYEDGDPSELEHMISSGALQNRLPADLDILGDFTLDFLTVNDDEVVNDGVVEHTHGTTHHPDHDSATAALGLVGEAEDDDIVHHHHHHTSNPDLEQLHAQQQGHNKEEEHTASHHHRPGRSSATVATDSAPPPNHTHLQQQHGQRHEDDDPQQQYTNMVTPAYDDGIGDLDFAGEFVSDQTDDYNMQIQTSTMNYGGIGGGSPGGLNSVGGSKQTSACGSPTETATTMSSDHERRLRSNSLFSALLSDEGGRTASASYKHSSIPEGAGSGGDTNEESQIVVDDTTTTTTNDDNKYERWMERVAGSTSMLPIEETRSSPSITTATTTISQGIKIMPPKSRNASTPQLTGGIGASLAAVDVCFTKEELKQQKKELREQRKAEREKLKKEKAEAMGEKSSSSTPAKTGRKKKEDRDKEKDDDAAPMEHIPGSGMPRALSDPNLRTTHDAFGLIQVDRPDGWVGAYSPESRKVRIDRFLNKRNKRVWSKTIKYDVRKNFADSRLRVKGRFVRKEDELLMRELMSLT